MNISLRIERLILDGLPMTSAQRTALGTALEAELGRLLRTGGLHGGLAQGVALSAVRVEPVQFETPFDPVRAGVSIAQALYAGIASPAPAASERESL
jgi:hypothetical protein